MHLQVVSALGEVPSELTEVETDDSFLNAHLRCVSRCILTQEVNLVLNQLEILRLIEMDEGSLPEFLSVDSAP